jgi:hypothetical protein
VFYRLRVLLVLFVLHFANFVQLNLAPSIVVALPIQLPYLRYLIQPASIRFIHRFYLLRMACSPLALSNYRIIAKFRSGSCGYNTVARNTGKSLSPSLTSHFCLQTYHLISVGCLAHSPFSIKWKLRSLHWCQFGCTSVPIFREPNAAPMVFSGLSSGWGPPFLFCAGSSHRSID